MLSKHLLAYKNTFNDVICILMDWVLKVHFFSEGRLKYTPSVLREPPRGSADMVRAHMAVFTLK